VKGPLHDDGWFRSFDEHRSVDLQGRPIPFITYPAMAFLSRRIRPGMAVFEYGSGASTLWWSSRAARVVSCEHNREWFEKVSAQAPDNVQILYQPLDPPGAYAAKISGFPNQFDIVVIDGRDRVNCARTCLPALKPDGVIVWDNSDRDKYGPGYQFLLENGFHRVDFIGLAPIENNRSETSIFYRPDNCLAL
jgi:tRNA A58 N-methylase Trm61